MELSRYDNREVLSVYHLFSPRDTSPHRINQERLDEGREDEQRERDLEEHPDRMNNLVSEPYHVTPSDSFSECHAQP